MTLSTTDRLHRALTRAVRGALLAAACLPVLAAHAEAAAAEIESSSGLMQVVSSATRFHDRVADVPIALSVTRGEDFEARGVHDAREALDTVVGVTTGPGGDDGSAGFSLSLLGRREIDDFLLVVDGVPLGGAFVPQFAALSLEHIDRIEVLRGTAPVYFGTTAFAGTVSVDHPAAGMAPLGLDASVGLRGTYRAAASGSHRGEDWQQSLLIDRGLEQGPDPRAGWQRNHALWRLATTGQPSALRVDLEWTDLTDRPTSPTPFDETTALLPLDLNQNPLGAQLLRRIGKLTVAYDHTLAGLPWQTLASVTRTRYAGDQGFVADPESLPASTEGSGFHQRRDITDGFLDSHLTWTGLHGVDVTAGFNVLLGQLSIANRLYSYELPLDGTPPDTLADVTPEGASSLDDRRTMVGVYAQSRWRPTETLTVLAGLRYNDLQESQEASTDGESEAHHQHLHRFSGSLGADAALWRAASDPAAISVYASLGSTFQPPQIDFGPDPSLGPLLAPETLQGAVLGIRAHTRGAWEFDAAYHHINVDHRSVTVLVDGLPQLAASGAQTVRGLELEGRWHSAGALGLSFEYAHNDACYGHFPYVVDGATTDLTGRRIELVPGHVGGVSVDWLPAQGWQGAVTAKFVGSRLPSAGADEALGGYTLVNAYVGYRSGATTVWLRGENLLDRRDPTLASDFGEGQLYRLEGVRAMLGVSVRAR